MEYQEIKYPGYGEFKIFAPNDILKYRATSFLSKEPTTIDWIGGLEKDSVVVDVGANIGIYAIPLALFHVKKVIAIEPEIRSYNMLLDNLELNDIADQKVEALPIAISTDYAGSPAKIYLTEDIAGSSCHQVGVNQNHLLEKTPRAKRKSRSVFCVSLASIIEHVSKSHAGPIHIKIDVDGIEADVCQSLFDTKLIHRISSLQIELNKAIPQHKELIERLSHAGFEFSEQQVCASIRKSGNFKGFAEIVFKRTIDLEAALELPSEFINYLGSNYSPVIKECHESPGKFFNSESVGAVSLSRFPSSFALKNNINVSRCTNLFRQIAHQTLREKSGGYEFESVLDGNRSSSSRVLIKNSTINKFSASYLEEAKKNFRSRSLVAAINEFSRIASSKIFSTGYFNRDHPRFRLNGLESIRMYCRIRHFLDLHGYSLSRHNDSFDTYCALIAPLCPYSTHTSLVGGSFFDRDSVNIASTKSEDRLQDSDFGKHKYFASLKERSYCELYYNDSYKKYVSQTPYSLHESSLKNGEIFVIPNPLWVAYGQSKDPQIEAAKHVWDQFGHGVLPSVVEPYRPILLVDYMLLDHRESTIETDERIMLDLGPASHFVELGLR